MQVVYKKTLVDQIDEEIDRASNRGKQIEYIELSKEEHKEFLSDGWLLSLVYVLAQNTGRPVLKYRDVTIREAS